MDKKNVYLLIKILNQIPRPIQKKVGYSFIGTKLINFFKKDSSRIPFTIDNDLKIFLELTNPFTWDLILGKDYEKNVKKTFLEIINPGDTIIDVGAHIGEYTLLGAKIVGPTGTVISVEPLHETNSSLRNNVDLNNFKNCQIIEKAVGEKPGKQILYKVSEGDVYGYLDSTIKEKKLIKGSEIDVTTIDEIINSRNLQKVELLKIDIEGFEYEALLGSKDSLKNNKIKNIICEIHSDFLKSKGVEENSIYELLEQYGFSIKKIQTIESKKTSNILATRKQEQNE